jgi:hypothetical protein
MARPKTILTQEDIEKKYQKIKDNKKKVEKIQYDNLLIQKSLVRFGYPSVDLKLKKPKQETNKVVVYFNKDEFESLNNLAKEREQSITVFIKSKLIKKVYG